MGVFLGSQLGRTDEATHVLPGNLGERHILLDEASVGPVAVSDVPPQSVLTDSSPPPVIPALFPIPPASLDLFRGVTEKVVAPPPPTVAAADGDPLSAHESDLRAAERAHNLPTGILTAIAIRESSYGAAACAPHNAWGYLDPTCVAFDSWEQGAETVAATLRHWIDVRGNLRDALCTWESGQVCSVSGDWYATEVLALLQ